LSFCGWRARTLTSKTAVKGGRGQPYSPRMVSTQAVSLPGSRVVTAQHANRTRHCRGAGSEIQSVTLGSAQFEHSFRILHKNSGLGRNLGT